MKKKRSSVPKKKVSINSVLLASGHKNLSIVIAVEFSALPLHSAVYAFHLRIV